MGGVNIKLLVHNADLLQQNRVFENNDILDTAG